MPHYPINTRLPNNHTPSMPHYLINTRLPNNHTPIYATLPYQYQTAQQPYPHLCHTTLSIPDCPTTIPPSMPHYPINTRLPNNHTHIYATLPYQYHTAQQPYPIYATLPYQYQTAQQPYPHLYHTTLSIPDCPTTIPSSMPHCPINTILPNNHTPIYATLPYQYQTAQQPHPHLCHTTLSIPYCPTTIPPSMPHYPINTRLPNNHTLIYATLPYQYHTAQQPYPPSMPHYPINTRLPNNHTLIYATLHYQYHTAQQQYPPSMPHYPINTILPNNHTLIYATLPYQYQTAQQPHPHLCHTTLSIPYCPTTIPPSMPHYPINTRLPNNHTLIYATLPYQYHTAQQPHPIYATLPYQYHTAKQPYPHLCHTTLSIPDCPTTIPSSMPHYPINTILPNNHTPSMPQYPINTRLTNNHTLIYTTLPYQYQTAQQPYPHLCHTTLSIPDYPTTLPPSMPHYPINTRLPNNHTPSMPHYPINTRLPNNHTPIYATLPYQYQTAQQPYPHLCHTTLSIPDCPTLIPPSMPHYPINTRLPNNHTHIYATLPYQYQTAQ